MELERDKPSGVGGLPDPAAAASQKALPWPALHARGRQLPLTASCRVWASGCVHLLQAHLTVSEQATSRATLRPARFQPRAHGRHFTSSKLAYSACSWTTSRDPLSQLTGPVSPEMTFSPGTVPEASPDLDLPSLPCPADPACLELALFLRQLPSWRLPHCPPVCSCPRPWRIAGHPCAPASAQLPPAFSMPCVLTVSPAQPGATGHWPRLYRD